MLCPNRPKSLLPKRGCWAPGNYISKCVSCDEQFEGDKRAVNCAPCAYANVPQIDVEAAKLLVLIEQWRNTEDPKDVIDNIRIHLKKLIGFDDYN
jgi:hypothetical protein